MQEEKPAQYFLLIFFPCKLRKVYCYIPYKKQDSVIILNTS